MKFKRVTLAAMVHNPHCEKRGIASVRNEYSAADGYDIEVNGPFLFIRGQHGVQVTSVTNLVDGDELVSPIVEKIEKLTAAKGKR